MGYLPGSHDFKVHAVGVGSSCSWKLLNPLFEQKISCFKQAGGGRSSAYLFFNCSSFVCLSTTSMAWAQGC